MDLGTNIDCNENGGKFSEMGQLFTNLYFPTEIAKVALLNIGSEIKDNILKKAHSNLKQISNNGDFVFNGYIEGNKITDGFSNVIVTDGFEISH